jgi:hypothetical protein
MMLSTVKLGKGNVSFKKFDCSRTVAECSGMDRKYIKGQDRAEAL